jgi:hypothetical protein
MFKIQFPQINGRAKTSVWEHCSEGARIQDGTVPSNKHSALTSTYQTGVMVMF